MILNYTTTIDPFKTASEIEYILMQHKAKSILKNMDADGRIVSMSFLVDRGNIQIPVKLPVKVDATLQVLQREKQNNPRKQIRATREQAERVAWRILKDWIEAQMALLDIEMADLEEVFMPYILDYKTGQTLYERLEEKQFLLEIR